MLPISGWTCITVEPIDTTETKQPDQEKLDTAREQLKDAMTVADVEQAHATLEQVLAKSGEIEPAKKIHDYLQDRVENGMHDRMTYDETTAVLGPRNLADDDQKAKQYAQEIFDDCEYAQRVLIVSANDTSDSGTGILFERSDDGDAVKVDKEEGYEGACGRDVTGYFREEYDISGVTTPH